MDGIEITDFLKSQQTGVLSLADDDESYAIPVSFAYQNGDIYIRLGYGTDSQKRDFVETSDYVSFVVYDRTDDGWKSVVVRGTPETLAENSVDSTIAEVTRTLEIPFFRVFRQDTDELEFNIVRIEVDDSTGIVSGGERSG